MSDFNQALCALQSDRAIYSGVSVKVNIINLYSIASISGEPSMSAEQRLGPRTTSQQSFVTAEGLPLRGYRRILPDGRKILRSWLGNPSVA